MLKYKRPAEATRSPLLEMVNLHCRPTGRLHRYLYSLRGGVLREHVSSPRDPTHTVNQALTI